MPNTITEIKVQDAYIAVDFEPTGDQYNRYTDGEDVSSDEARMAAALARLTGRTVSGVVKIPVAEFSISYAVDGIPTATIVPAVGKEWFTGKVSDILPLVERQRAGLILKVDGEYTMLLDGYINNTTSQANYSIGSVNTKTSLTLVHRASRLFGSPFSSYAFVSQTQTVIGAINDRVAMNIFGDKSVNSGYGQGYAVGQALYGASRNNMALFPATVIKDYILKIASNTFGPDYYAEIDDVLEDYEPANLSTFTPGYEAIYNAIHDGIVRSLPSGSLGTAMTQVIATMFLHTIPTPDKLIICNPVSLHETVDVVLNASEFMGMSAQTSETTVDPIDHVIVHVRNGKLQDAKSNAYADTYYAYPPFMIDGEPTTDLGVATGQNPQGTFCHLKEAPQWIMRADTFQIRADRNNNARAERTRTIVNEESVTVGRWLAQTYYAYMDNKNFSVPNLVLPFRKDIMPGTIIQVNGFRVPGDREGVYSSIVGMVRSVSINCSAGVSLMMTVSLKDVRHKQYNVTMDEGGIALSKPGLYEERWVGIDIEGNHLTDLPSHATPTTITSDPVKEQGVVDKSKGLNTT